MLQRFDSQFLRTYTFHEIQIVVSSSTNNEV